MIQSLCNHYSPPLLSLPHPFCPTEVHTYHPFPSPSALCGSGVGLKLQSLGFGFHADFVHRTSKMLVDTHGLGTPVYQNYFSEASEIWLRELRNISTVAAREELLKFPGVGRKVADCVLLMSLDKVFSEIPILYLNLPLVQIFRKKLCLLTLMFIRLLSNTMDLRVAGM
jgi:N-glycosylase/DNA lyase